jgi:hypothetical protein
MWVSVQVASPTIVASSSTADSTSPQRSTLSCVSSYVDKTKTLERSSPTSSLRSRWLVTGNVRPTSTRSLSAADTSELWGIPSATSKAAVHQASWNGTASRRDAAIR